MKKKIEALLRDGSVVGNAEYQVLHKAHLSAKRALERAKKEKSEAKTAYQDALDNSEKDHDRLFELLTVFRQSKYMSRYHRATFKLAKHRLHRWLEDCLKNMEVPHEPLTSRSAKYKSKKIATEKSAKVKTSSQGKTPKAAGKPAPKPAKKAA